MSMTDPVNLYQKDLCHWEVRIIQIILDLYRGTEISEVIVEESPAVFRNVARMDILLRSMEITHKVISVGGWHSVHKPAD